MTFGKECLLEQARADKIKSLGFVCYNQYVDGSMAYPEMHAYVQEIKKTISILSATQKDHLNVEYIRAQEKKVGELLETLGMICYNLYNDSKLISSNVLELCDSIASINEEISQDIGAFNVQKRVAPAEMSNDANLSVGMEPIPEGYITCACGYRNRPEANFCGKCGAELH